MVIVIRLFIALTFSLCALAEWNPEPSPEQSEHRPHINWALPQVLHLYQNHHACTAFIVGKNLVATAAHCIDSKGQIVLESIYNKKTEAKPLYVGQVGEKDDVAILWAPTGKIVPLDLSKARPVFPSFCEFVGYAGTAHQSILPCIVKQAGQFGYDLNGQARGGDSGGPLFGADGKIIGIITRSDRNLSIAATDLRFLRHALMVAQNKLKERASSYEGILKNISCRWLNVFCSY